MSTASATAVRIIRADQTYLAALLASVTQSRLFVRSVCSSWQLETERAAVAELLASELAANAVQASGVTRARPVTGPACTELKLVGVRVLQLQGSLVIEVWDTSPQPPVLMEPDEAAECGRGLQLVDALSIRWGHYGARTGGKVVWCEIACGGNTNRAGDPDAFRQVLQALQQQAWNDQA